MRPLKAQMKADEARKRQLDAALAKLNEVSRIADVDRDRLRRLLKERVADLRGLFNANTPKARQALRKIVVGKLLMEPVTVSGKRGYKSSGQLAFGRLLPADLAQLEKPCGPNGIRYLLQGSP